MSNKADQHLEAILQQRRHDGSIRTLTHKQHLVDLCSNDYLGMARSQELYQQAQDAYARIAPHQNGATGSRLISGNYPLYEELEAFIADYHQAEAGLLFNSGYDANLGFFGTVPQPNDLVLADELVHASIRDGLKMCRGKHHYFHHNNVEEIERILQETDAEKVFIAVESVYSMDGDFAPLEELVNVAEKYHAFLVVDEAHATGIFGPKGEGRVVELGLQKKVYARIHTFGKALGAHGAIVLGSETLKQFLVNYARSFIYTTALPVHSLVFVKTAYDILSKECDKKLKISDLVSLFIAELKVSLQAQLIPSKSAIQSLLIPGNEQAKRVSLTLEEAGFYAKAILYPTVPKGKERIRFCFHTFNTKEQILKLVEVLNKAINI